jgi:very-short-patch-repair endonuclease
VTTVAKVRAGRKFCSHACSNITKNRLSKKSGTSLENTIEAWFADKGIQFEKQVPLLGITLADFVVGTTVIQCDGVYWHTLVGRADKDREQDSRLNAAGYTVVRISDSELKDDTLDRIMLRKSIIASLHNQHRVSWQA